MRPPRRNQPMNQETPARAPAGAATAPYNRYHWIRTRDEHRSHVPIPLGHEDGARTGEIGVAPNEADCWRGRNVNLGDLVGSVANPGPFPTRDGTSGAIT